MNEGCEDTYVGKTIYIIGYPNSEKLKVSYGVLKNKVLDKEYNFNYLCSTEKGLSGSPILNLENNAIIGIHKQCNSNKNYNTGAFLKLSINDFISKNYYNNNINNNINDNSNNNTNNIYNNCNTFYNGYIFDYTKKLDEDSFWPTIFIENYSTFCRGSFWDIYNEYIDNIDEPIKTMKYPLKKYDNYNYDFVSLENNWGKIFTELKINPKQHNIIILEEDLMTPKEVREKMAQIMFETFEVKGLYFIKKPIYKFIGVYPVYGKGIIIDSGDYSTNIIPIFDCYILPHACIKCDFGGKELNKYMIELLSIKCVNSIRKCDYEFEDKENEEFKIVLCGENSNNLISNFGYIISNAIFEEFHSKFKFRLFKEEKDNQVCIYYFFEKYFYQDFITFEEWEESGCTMLHRKFF